MVYYKVIQDGKHDFFTGNTTIKNELLTERERHSKFRYLMDSVFKKVEISKRNTFKCFGARFEKKEGENN